MLAPQWGVSLPKVATQYNQRCTAYTYTMQQRLTYQHRPPTHALNFDAAQERPDEPSEDQDTLFTERR